MGDMKLAVATNHPKPEVKPETGGKEGRDSNGYIYSLCKVVNYICLTRNMALRSFLVFLEIRMCYEIGGEKNWSK